MQQPCKILVVDDEPLLKSLIFQKFKSQINAKELEFHFASNGLEALDQLENDREVGVILTDIKMPQMDGITLMQHLALQERLYKIIVITAYGDMSNIRKAMHAGASDFILKPFDMKDFETSLMNMVHQFQFLKEGLKAKDRMIQLSKEFEIAKEIKKSFIPINFSTFPADRVSLMGEMLSSRTLGGDFFDFFPFSEHELGIILANVAGKGVPAALYTAIMQMLGRAVGSTCEKPSECIGEIHQFLLKEIPPHALKGLFYGVFNLQTGNFSYCNDKDVVSYFISQEGNLIDLKACNEISMKINEKIFITTKELATSRNSQHESYGEERLKRILMENYACACKELIQKVKEDFNHFAIAEEDVPLFCLQCNFE